MIAMWREEFLSTFYKHFRLSYSGYSGPTFVITSALHCCLVRGGEVENSYDLFIAGYWVYYVIISTIKQFNTGL